MQVKILGATGKTDERQVHSPIVQESLKVSHLPLPYQQSSFRVLDFGVHEKDSA